MRATSKTYHVSSRIVHVSSRFSLHPWSMYSTHHPQIQSMDGVDTGCCKMLFFAVSMFKTWTISRSLRLLRDATNLMWCLKSFGYRQLEYIHTNVCRHCTAWCGHRLVCDNNFDVTVVRSGFWCCIDHHVFETIDNRDLCITAKSSLLQQPKL